MPIIIIIKNNIGLRQNVLWGITGMLFSGGMAFFLNLSTDT